MQTSVADTQHTHTHTEKTTQNYFTACNLRSHLICNILHVIVVSVVVVAQKSSFAKVKLKDENRKKAKLNTRTNYRRKVNVLTAHVAKRFRSGGGRDDNNVICCRKSNKNKEK